MKQYVPRAMTYRDAAGNLQRVMEDSLPQLGKAIVILGEPGLGKTWLLRQLADKPGFIFRSASSFVHHPNPAGLVPTGTTILVDGLDELAAVNDADPVNRVLGKLIEAGCPPFMLTCRAAEWNSTIASQDISDAYGAPPLQVSIAPFSRDDAVAFLVANELVPQKAAKVVEHLDKRSMTEFYCNPLTLKLLTQTIKDKDSLPESRAALIDEATRLMWREHDDRHTDSALANLDEEAALTAAGLISAVFVLTGAEFISNKPSNATDASTILASDLRSLPGGDHASIIVGTRLFPPVPSEDGRFKPIHRAVAEFLGAKWLAKFSTDDLACERLQSALVIFGGVPSSLRGIHAWLARDKRFTARVIEKDAYGLLRYGDADNLDASEGRLLLKQLTKLQKEDSHCKRFDSSRTLE
jgi:hypothetical protein